MQDKPVSVYKVGEGKVSVALGSSYDLVIKDVGLVDHLIIDTILSTGGFSMLEKSGTMVSDNTYEIFLKIKNEEEPIERP